jgi:hypothetical protein
LAYRFGLIGSITRDVSTTENGFKYEGLGGILYHAAALCGLGQEVLLMANAGEGMHDELRALAAGWPGLDINRVQYVPGPGNLVHLHYPRNGEREEVLQSVVPPLSARQILPILGDLDFLIFVASSGMDMEPGDWKRVKSACSCPTWFDVHSLVLSRELGRPRIYRPFKDWMEWTEGVDFVQANRAEAACMLSGPGDDPGEEALIGLARLILRRGSRAVFFTMGRDGVFILDSRGKERRRPQTLEKAVDTTGCGDIFASATAYRLVHGENPAESSSFGLEIASRAAGTAGVDQAFSLARSLRKNI